MPSIIAELGYVIEKHLQTIGVLARPEMDENLKKLIRAEKSRVRRAQQAAGSVFEGSHP
jgi:hypothetical protein